MKKIIKYTNYVYVFCSFTSLLLGLCFNRIELIYVFVFLFFSFIILAIIETKIEENNKIEKDKNKIIDNKPQDELINLNDINEESNDKYNIKFVDDLDGLQFEEYISNLLIELGYTNVTVTPASGDFGIDVVAEKDDVKYAFQCKNYNSSLSNKCVQEAYSGKQFYNCHVGVVITNNYFTNHAKELANKNGILLWDRDKLINLLNKAKQKALN